MKIAICSDHAGFELKQIVNQYLIDKKPVAYHDFGTYTAESCDYADFAHPMASAVEQGEFDFGISICGSGNGISMTVNKHQGIRA
ncbi:MAG: RpiB/LacA/LacB family sugar-phosphate isomerase, partial [Paludibacter sp.]|nr:RpiB/LacA/LacB family sugar-phosphate isomerase [Paludibacter sp.]